LIAIRLKRYIQLVHIPMIPATPTATASAPDSFSLLEQDASRFEERLHEFDQRIVNPEVLVCLVSKCPDARVVLPEEVLTITTNTGQKLIQMIAVPTIGSGSPNRTRLETMIKSLSDKGVRVENIRIVVTQHGDSDEIDSADHPNHVHDITCGLRSMLHQITKTVPDFEHTAYRFREWVLSMKQKLDDPSWAPDHVPLADLRRTSPVLMGEITSIAGQLHLPVRLLMRAIWRNTDESISRNEQSVLEKVYEKVRSMTDPRWRQIPISSALYDHMTKTMYFSHSNVEGDLLSGITLTLPEIANFIPERQDPSQDPDYVITRFGWKLLDYPLETLFPNLVHGTTISDHEKQEWSSDNVFETVASSLSLPTLFCAVGEAYYAISHRFPWDGGQPHGTNFRKLKRYYLVCQDAEYFELAKIMTQTDEYKSDFAQVFSQMGELVVVNANLDQPEGHRKPSWETLSLPKGG
jgi:hypothetical protein